MDQLTVSAGMKKHALLNRRQHTFNEYLNEVTRLMNAIDLLNEKIEEFSKNERYGENVSRLRYFAGINTHAQW